MESEVSSSFDVNTFFPNEEEFKDFGAYIRKISLLCNTSCFAKISPPHTINSKNIRSKIMLKNVIAQSVADRVTDNSGNIVGYHLSFDHQVSMEFGEYQQLGLNMDKNNKGKSMAEQEDRFWQEIALRTNDVSKAPLYASDNEIVLFARGQTNCWDLSKLTSSDSLIHQPDVDLIPGVHTPYSYAGHSGTTFCFHKEDSDLCSVNYHHEGESKFWYGVPDSERDKLQCLIQEIARKLNISCSQYVRHKNIMIPPSVLKAYGIQFTRIVQSPGEFVISFSGGFHQGFNVGFNLNSAVNFADNRWLHFYQRFELCDCKYSLIPRKIHASLAAIVEKFSNLSSDATTPIEISLSTKTPSPIETSLPTKTPSPIEISLPTKTPTQFQCQKCPLMYFYARGLKEHIEKIHGEFILRYACFKCSSSFVNKTLWVKHVTEKHKTSVDLRTAEKYVQKIRATKKLAEENARKKRKTIRRALTCDVIVAGQVCGTVVHGNWNLKRHKTFQHQIID